MVQTTWLCRALCGLAMAALASRGSGADLRTDLQAVARRSVFFGHQSVGTNIVDGVRELAAGEAVPLRLVEVESARGLPPGTFAHGFVAENGDPLRKLTSFAQALGAGPTTAEIALLKLCFVDIDENTAVKPLFERYQAELAALQARFPATTFVHVTTPLTVVPRGPKAAVKRLLGRERNEPRNSRREDYNALLRRAYAGKEPIFDLALVEATRPDGSLQTSAVEGTPVPALVPEYTDDGGHLNALGRRTVAQALISLLASLPPSAAP